MPHKMAESRCKTEQNDSAIMTSALESAIQFLQRYPELTQFVVNKSSYQFDIHSLIVDAKKMNLAEAVEDIRKEFATNGSSSEFCDENQGSLEHSVSIDPIKQNRQSEKALLTEDESTRVDDPANESAECNVLQDITNHTKDRPRRNLRKNGSHPKHCVFCHNNGATREEYESHHCKDEWGNVTCPVLQNFVCSRCNATGTNAHTAKYCPQKPIITPEDCVAIEKRWQQKRRRRLVQETIGANGQSKPIVETKATSRIRL